MLTNLTEQAHIWNTLQQPRCPSRLPTSYLLLLSALDGGWRIEKVEIQPSWDQHGLVYLVALKNPSSHRRQELILPRTGLVESLLDEGFLLSLESRQLQPVCI